MRNSLRELPDYLMWEFSVLLWYLPGSMEEMCCRELSDLELAPPAGTDSKDTVNNFKHYDFLRHLSSYLPVSRWTQMRFNGAERNTFCLSSQDSKAWTVTKTETENLSCKSN